PPVQPRASPPSTSLQRGRLPTPRISRPPPHSFFSSKLFWTRYLPNVKKINTPWRRPSSRHMTRSQAVVSKPRPFRFSARRTRGFRRRRGSHCRRVVVTLSIASWPNVLSRAKQRQDGPPYPRTSAVAVGQG